MSDIWGYPYRLGITLFLIVGTALLTVGFVGIAVWLEKSFKNEKIKK
ncbi:MAG: hypothetical protein HY201_03060 [Nitrospirae bacterium]|nr:hypothetical protein [Candidatus Troglogloeales bacterium]MBI3598422.1 hypothetical protein [Candidatus Troglogloeales bacterium]